MEDTSGSGRTAYEEEGAEEAEDEGEESIAESPGFDYGIVLELHTRTRAVSNEKEIATKTKAMPERFFHIQEGNNP